MSRRRFNVFRDGHIYVMARQCKTCIFRPDQEVIPLARLEEMRRGAIEEQTCIVCHDTIGTKTSAVCRGFYNRDREQTLPLWVAELKGLVRFQESKCR